MSTTRCQLDSAEHNTIRWHSDLSARIRVCICAGDVWTTDLYMRGGALMTGLFDLTSTTFPTQPLNARTRCHGH
jgi:hypothetical protein